MIEKANGIVTKIEKKTSQAGKDYFFATIGGVRFLFFDKKIEECQDKEIEIEYTEKTNEKGTTFIGNFPGATKTGSGALKRGLSPEELHFKKIDAKLRTKTMVMSYAKDLWIANHKQNEMGTEPEASCKEMDVYIKYMLGLVAGNIKELEG